MPRKIIVINSKGGCGKTTISTNLASGYATRGYAAVLMDFDPQDSAMHWLGQRPRNLPPIHGVAAAHKPGTGVTRSFQLRVPQDAQRVILDTPASMKKMELIEILRDASAIIIPILPSTIDSHVTADFIQNLGSMTRIHAPDVPVGVVANRVRKNTAAFRQMIGFLDELGMPPVTCLRDTQNYIKAAEQGLGIHEMKPALVQQDLEHWQVLFTWLEEPERALRAQAKTDRPDGQGDFWTPPAEGGQETPLGERHGGW